MLIREIHIKKEVGWQLDHRKRVSNTNTSLGMWSVIWPEKHRELWACGPGLHAAHIKHEHFFLPSEWHFFVHTMMMLSLVFLISLIMVCRYLLTQSASPALWFLFDCDIHSDTDWLFVFEYSLVVCIQCIIPYIKMKEIRKSAHNIIIL